MLRDLSIVLFLITSYTVQAQDQKVQVLSSFEEVEALLEGNDEEVKVINFWATWCIPCVKELPYFEAYHEENGGVHLISLDFTEYEDKVIALAEKKALTAPIYLYDNPKYNDWIDKVSPDWSGALPATVISYGDKQIFWEGELDAEKLEELVLQIRE